LKRYAEDRLSSATMMIGGKITDVDARPTTTRNAREYAISLLMLISM
jgi:hypothetical protein